METKKILAPTIVAIVTLVVLTVGATYAYFVVGTTNTFGTRTVEAATPEVASVALTSGNDMILNLTPADMMNKGIDTAYYASASGTTTANTSLPIATATKIGTSTGSNTLSCSYTLKITDNDNSLYDAFQAWSGKTTEQIVLVVDKKTYDFNTESLFPLTISGDFTILPSTTKYDIKASLKIVNKVNINQNELAGQNITLSFNIESFSCTAL